MLPERAVPNISDSFSEEPVEWVGKYKGRVLSAMGRTSLSASRAANDLNLLAFSRKMRPRRILRHPTENKKNAETRENLSTWCERTAAPNRHCMTPRAPRPKLLPRMGKNLSKKDAGHPTSDMTRTMDWKMISSLLRTAQKAPAA